MKYLITGAAGFIGFHLVVRLHSEGHTIIGLDNINNYYDPALKYARLQECGIAPQEVADHKLVKSQTLSKYQFVKADLLDRDFLQKLFAEEHFDVVVNLAAQAGVRYSLENPYAYIESNIVGFLNLLECARHNPVQHFVYASSSSVYGINGNVPFSEHDSIAHPVSLYAATKKSNELMAHVYSKLYSIPTTGLRFFTVYGPWGRPDMSPFLFMDAILNDRPIKVFNNGDMLRDFTFIDDIIEGVARISKIVPSSNSNWDETSPDPATSQAPYRLYNIGNSHPIRLMDYIHCIERAIGREAQKEFLPMQPGDVYQTYADSSALAATIGFKPNTDLQAGINRTVDWFREYNAWNKAKL